MGGARVPVRTLSGVSERLVAIHGQADQWRLKRPSQHRALLDAFGGDEVADPAAQVAQVVAEYGAGDGRHHRPGPRRPAP